MNLGGRTKTNRPEVLPIRPALASRCAKQPTINLGRAQRMVKEERARGPPTLAAHLQGRSWGVTSTPFFALGTAAPAPFSGDWIPRRHHPATARPRAHALLSL